MNFTRLIRKETLVKLIRLYGHSIARCNKLDELHLTWRPSIDNDQEQSDSGMIKLLKQQNTETSPMHFKFAFKTFSHDFNHYQGALLPLVTYDM